MTSTTHHITAVSDPFYHLYNSISSIFPFLSFFFFNDPATTEIYTLSLHDALPIYRGRVRVTVRLMNSRTGLALWADTFDERFDEDRKSTRLNSSHVSISYAVFCLKKKKK